jgi:protein-S-isoprenylcysteine O-methyltransferase Ste14
MQETVIRYSLGFLVLAFFVVRAYHHRKAQREGGKIEYRESNFSLIAAIRAIGGLVLFTAMGMFFFKPEWIAWADMPFPLWLRWFGVGMGAVCVPLIWWIEASLGLNFQTTLHVREGHSLVTHGPYAYVRHPMYTGLLLFTIAWLLASANWLVGLPGLLGLPAILINRVSREEAVMIELFGDEYRAYMQRTGRFLPRLGI